jgi:hypothetical protein
MYHKPHGVGLSEERCGVPPKQGHIYMRRRFPGPNRHQPCRIQSICNGPAIKTAVPTSRFVGPQTLYCVILLLRDHDRGIKDFVLVSVYRLSLTPQQLLPFIAAQRMSTTKQGPQHFIFW